MPAHSLFSGEAIANIVGSFIGVIGAFGASWYGLRRQLENERQRWTHSRLVEGGVEPVLELLSSAKAQIDDYLSAKRVTKAFDVDFGRAHSSFYRIKRHLESMSLWPDSYNASDPIERVARDLALSLRDTTRRWENASISENQWEELRKTLQLIKEYFSALEECLEKIERLLGSRGEEKQELLRLALGRVVSSASRLGVYSTKQLTSHEAVQLNNLRTHGEARLPITE